MRSSYPRTLGRRRQLRSCRRENVSRRPVVRTRKRNRWKRILGPLGSGDHLGEDESERRHIPHVRTLHVCNIRSGRKNLCTERDYFKTSQGTVESLCKRLVENPFPRRFYWVERKLTVIKILIRFKTRVEDWMSVIDVIRSWSLNCNIHFTIIY